MKNLQRIAQLLISVALLSNIIGCSDLQAGSEGRNGPIHNDISYSQYPTHTNKAKVCRKEPLVVREWVDKTGYPLPKSWKVTSKQTLTGPNKLQVTPLGAKYFNGRATGLKQFVRNDLAGLIRKKDGRITKIYPLNSVAGKMANYMSKVYHANGMRTACEALGVEVEDPEGKPGFMLLQQIEYSSFGVRPLYLITITALECEADYYPFAVQSLVYAFAHSIDDEQSIAAFNRNARQKAARDRRSWERTNRAIVDANNATNDAIMGTYRSSSASFDRSNQNIVNGIREESTMYNEQSGNSIQVEYGNDRYYSNIFDEYYGTDDAFHQPEDQYSELTPADPK